MECGGCIAAAIPDWPHSGEEGQSSKSRKAPATRWRTPNASRRSTRRAKEVRASVWSAAAVLPPLFPTGPIPEKKGNRASEEKRQLLAGALQTLRDEVRDGLEMFAPAY